MKEESYSHLLIFLNPENIDAAREQWKDGIYNHFNQVTYVSEVELDVWYEVEDGFTNEPMLFYDALKSLLQQRIADYMPLVHHLRDFAAKSNREYCTKIDRQIAEIERRLHILKGAHPGAMQALEPQTNNLLVQLRKSKADVMRQGVNRHEVKPFSGYSLTYKGLKGKEHAFLLALFNLLVEDGMLSKESEKTFIGLYTQCYNGTKIRWMGTPKEFWALYDVLFNPIANGNVQLIKVEGRQTTRMQYKCFEVYEASKLLKGPRGRKYNNNSKNVSYFIRLEDSVTDLVYTHTHISH